MNINAHSIWSDIQKIHNSVPLIHNITNYVVMNNTANALLALGASPVMAHAIEEVEDMVSIARALVINIGTLSETWIEAMQKAMQKAHELKKPIVLDPVGAGATPYRTATAQKLIETINLTVIRGNASEIYSLVGEDTQTKGVDSTQQSEFAIEAAKSLAQRNKCTVVISGMKDLIVNADQVIQIENGHPLMAKVTGMGCTATALIGAFLAVNTDAFIASAHATAVIGIAGEIAAHQATGPGSLQIHFLDALYKLKKEDIEEKLKFYKI
ncbi:hydroxyethylthiazole kinase [Nostoc flagelliforme FACHB-838]|uniref:Hydroxyethylthiazole kinase n=1 Tax=Nostoc flagelliforme FACHB-838 TaxID=2692904 RepID=A0ABR8DWF4_9NOSO|nr:hydroxyethylthiazole kinase [Nostoc flagelliforme]MBD2533769.1 hydroxyethylthiazole kinase [Nostoc flagelliforme FACHB-838]